MYFFYLLEQHHVFVTCLTGALYVHPLWFYKHQHDNRVRSKLFVACSAVMVSSGSYLQFRDTCGKRRNLNLILDVTPQKEITWGCIWWTRWQVVKTRTIISNNPVLFHFQVNVHSHSLSASALDTWPGGLQSRTGRFGEENRLPLSGFKPRTHTESAEFVGWNRQSYRTTVLWRRSR